uniref:Uncharacterized protein n=1 Tax=Rhizophora mucronata TaxID=61149 RepID=A0A2P2NHG5_RHIMU
MFGKEDKLATEKAKFQQFKPESEKHAHRINFPFPATHI